LLDLLEDNIISITVVGDLKGERIPKISLNLRRSIESVEAGIANDIINKPTIMAVI